MTPATMIYGTLTNLLTMLIYLDICCFNRPFDDQSQSRIRFETEAKLELQEQIRQQKVKLVWSYVLDFENKQNPFAERAASILTWRRLAEVRVNETEPVLNRGRSLRLLGLRPFDALHVACTMIAGADLFVTTDDILLRKLRDYSDLTALPPGDALAYVGQWYENRS